MDDVMWVTVSNTLANYSEFVFFKGLHGELIIIQSVK